jgi:hypothetical protein
MNLTDVVSSSGFSGYAQLGFIISLATFLGIVGWLLLQPKSKMGEQARVVLDDDDVRSDGRQA